ncbi:MAG: glycoside hydrolase family 16 protein [Flavobacteriales bacterium]|nr:glycoside hydrolase family 16 protein [Flavobacteriales bacterium]
MKLNKITPLVFAVLIATTYSCSSETEQKLEPRNWELVWADEFNEAAGTQPNPTKWTYDLGTGSNGWGNFEQQTYTNRPENVSMDGNGNLVITARRENFQGAQFTSARIKTQGIFDQKYGKFEARLKTPYGQGLWPAFWLLGNNINEVSWPQCGEIDVMELRGQLPSIINGSIHGPGFSGADALSGTYGLQNARFDTDYYTYAVEWDANKIDFFVNGFLYHRITKSEVQARGEWVFDHPFFMILNVAVGGNYVGAPNLGTPFPQKMIIDYVRVYKQKN